MSDRLTPEREAEIRERAPKRTAEFTEWLNKHSPLPGRDAAERAETVLEEDLPALLAELAAVRAERDEAQEQVERLEDRNGCLLDQQAKDDAEFSQLLLERDRYRSAWKSARFRAQAYGEGIERVVKDRESYQGWLKQAQENHAAYRIGAEGAKRMLSDRLNAVTDLCDEQDMAARMFELPTPEWIAAVRNAIEMGGAR